LIVPDKKKRGGIARRACEEKKGIDEKRTRKTQNGRVTILQKERGEVKSSPVCR